MKMHEPEKQPKYVSFENVKCLDVALGLDEAGKPTKQVTALRLLIKKTPHWVPVKHLGDGNEVSKKDAVGKLVVEAWLAKRENFGG